VSGLDVTGVTEHEKIYDLSHWLNQGWGSWGGAASRTQLGNLIKGSVNKWTTAEQWSVLSLWFSSDTYFYTEVSAICFVANMSMPTITHDDNKTYILPTIFHNIEQESGSKSRVRALTRDPTRPDPDPNCWPGDPLTRDPETRFHLCLPVCIVLHGTMRLFLVVEWSHCNIILL